MFWRGKGLKRRLAAVAAPGSTRRACPSCPLAVLPSVHPVLQGTKRQTSSTRKGNGDEKLLSPSGEREAEVQVLDWLVERASSAADDASTAYSAGRTGSKDRPHVFRISRSSPCSFQDCMSYAPNSGSEEEEFRTASEGTQGSREEDGGPMSVSGRVLAMVAKCRGFVPITGACVLAKLPGQ